MLLPFVCHAQKVTQINKNEICIEGDTILYFDAEGFSITEQAHSDSLKTHIGIQRITSKYFFL